MQGRGNEDPCCGANNNGPGYPTLESCGKFSNSELGLLPLYYELVVPTLPGADPCCRYHEGTFILYNMRVYPYDFEGNGYTTYRDEHCNAWWTPEQTGRCYSDDTCESFDDPPGFGPRYTLSMGATGVTLHTEGRFPLTAVRMAEYHGSLTYNSDGQIEPTIALTNTVDGGCGPWPNELIIEPVGEPS